MLLQIKIKKIKNKKIAFKIFFYSQLKISENIPEALQTFLHHQM